MAASRALRLGFALSLTGTGYVDLSLLHVPGNLRVTFVYARVRPTSASDIVSRRAAPLRAARGSTAARQRSASDEEDKAEATAKLTKRHEQDSQRTRRRAPESESEAGREDATNERERHRVATRGAFESGARLDRRKAEERK